jgi:hypothetical protein
MSACLQLSKKQMKTLKLSTIKLHKGVNMRQKKEEESKNALPE